MENTKQAVGVQDFEHSYKNEDGGELLITAIKAINEKKGEDIVSLDLRKVPEAVSDYFVICEASNPLQMKAIIDNIEKKVYEECGELPYEEQIGEVWSLIDYVNVVIHIFKREERLFYDLEGLWMDGKRTEITD